MKMGGGPKPFGIDAEAVPAALDAIGRYGLSFEGFHIFCGSQNLHHEAICDTQTQAMELAVRLAVNAPAPVKRLNLGGGFGIPYFPGDKPLDLDPIGEHLKQIVDVSRANLPEARLVLELGRYLVGEAGVYVARVVDRKVSRGEVFLVTDGGLHHHLAASGNFGQVIRKNYPVAIGTRASETQQEVLSVVGPLCTPLDVIADRMALPAAEPGDLVVVFQSGAYGLTASPVGFLSHPAPLEVLV
jgi:diaminopimelate decarboxylase